MYKSFSIARLKYEKFSFLLPTRTLTIMFSSKVKSRGTRNYRFSLLQRERENNFFVTVRSLYSLAKVKNRENNLFLTVRSLYSLAKKNKELEIFTLSIFLPFQHSLKAVKYPQRIFTYLRDSKANYFCSFKSGYRRAIILHVSVLHQATFVPPFKLCEKLKMLIRAKLQVKIPCRQRLEPESYFRTEFNLNSRKRER